MSHSHDRITERIPRAALEALLEPRPEEPAPLRLRMRPAASSPPAIGRGTRELPRLDAAIDRAIDAAIDAATIDDSEIDAAINAAIRETPRPDRIRPSVVLLSFTICLAFGFLLMMLLA